MTLRERIIDYVREHPGATANDLRVDLDTYYEKVRPVIRELAAEGVIRTQGVSLRMRVWSK